MTIVHIAIGNSDDKLTQREWSNYCADVCDAITLEQEHRVGPFDIEIHGVWYSHSSSPFQNMCVCADIPDELVLEVKEILSGLCREYRQDSIQWTVADSNRSGGITPKE